MDIIIDDLRSFKEEHRAKGDVYLRSSEAAIEFLSALGDTRIETLWLDYDLGGDDTIRPVVKWLLDQDMEIGEVYIHTSNPVGRVWIHGSLRGKYPCLMVDAAYMFEVE